MLAAQPAASLTVRGPAADPHRAARGCAPPSVAQAWASATSAEALLSVHPSRARLASRRGVQAGSPGHWVHLSDSGPVNGALAWWPCGATQARWLSTGGFVSWRNGPAVPGQPQGTLWLTSQRFGTGLQVQQLHWVAATARGPALVWQGDAVERFEGADTLQVQRSLVPQAGGRWQWVEHRRVNGRHAGTSRLALCWDQRTPRQVRLWPCSGPARQPMPAR